MKKKAKKKVKKKGATGSIDETWEECDVNAIYWAYPRHIRPVYAKTCIRRALSRIWLSFNDKHNASEANAVEYLLERSRKFASSPEGNKGMYTPHPATWYNQGGYDTDEEEWEVRNRSGRLLASQDKYSHLS